MQMQPVAVQQVPEKTEKPQRISPIADVKKRKLRDMFCTIFFIIFWLGIVAILVYGSKLPVKGKLPMMERAFLYVRPGDKIRRMCGYSTDEQPDKLAIDYSSYVMTDSQTEVFCEMMKKVHTTDVKL